MHDKLLRTALFVPAIRPDRLPKALASGADAVIVDLEDSVPRDEKITARRHLSEFALAHPDERFMVRINDGTTVWFDQDLALCRELPNVVAIVLPKAEAARHVHIVSGAGKPLMPVIESARGLRNLDGIAGAAGVWRLSFGILDLMLEFGTRPGTEGAARILDQIRYQILLHSGMNGLPPPLDTVYADFSDLEGLARRIAVARDMGFGGMLCIHPTQVPVVHEAFRPSADELDWARRVVDEAGRSGAQAFRVDGRMVDLPLIERARRLLARGVQ
ncbi:CoA ester lyase [Castellaniella sp. GW247-6E4]|uniref:HpcH/HpaI aldolase/citrate lyase family protein n=1 Tax=Castellaniella sp. GW247-6E4 TaxID=3140380 RepID=UPI003315D949